MTASAVVIGVGNEFRADDGVGPAVVAALRQVGGPSAALDAVELALSDGEPCQLLDLWAGRSLAVVVDAVVCEPSNPGRVHRTDLTTSLQGATASTHGLGIPDALRLAEVLNRAPGRLVVFAVEAADVGFGVGLSPAVQRAVPVVVDQVTSELFDSPAPGAG